MEEQKNLSHLEADYKGELKVSGTLLKRKQHSGLLSLFSGFVKRFFVLDLLNATFGYFKNSNCKKESYVIYFSV